MKGALTLGLFVGLALSAAFVLTSEWHRVCFTVLDSDASIASTGSEPPGSSFVVHEPCDECLRRMNPGDSTWEHRRYHGWIQVYWRRCSIERGGAVLSTHSTGAIGYFGVDALLVALPPILALILFPARKP